VGTRLSSEVGFEKKMIFDLRAPTARTVISLKIPPMQFYLDIQSELITEI
jgi:hypothetical protein